MMLWIEPYYRLRFGRLESVRGHWRRSPHKGGSVPVSAPLPLLS